MWHVDRGDYKRAYLAAVQAAPHVLAPELTKILSVPQGVVLHSRYFHARNRILVMGQETSQNWKPLLPPGDEADWARRAWAGEVGNIIDFDYAYGHPPAEAHPFWLAFEQIKDIFTLPSRRSLAWSNILKVQRIDDEAHVGVGHLAAPMPANVADWQAALFFQELKYIAPDAILFLTGDQRWVLKRMYERLHVPVAYHDRGIVNGHATWRIVDIPGLDIPMTQTYHPNAHPPGIDVQQARQDAASYLLDCLERRGRPRGGSLLDPFAD